MAIISIFIFLLVLALPVVIITSIIMAVTKKNKETDEKTEHSNFEKTIRSIYVYFVLICLLLAVIGGTLYFFDSAVDLLLPEKSNSDYYYNSVARDKNVAIVGMITSASMLISTVPLFVYYSKVAKNEILKKKK